jgi:hypothetical protein
MVLGTRYLHLAVDVKLAVAGMSGARWFQLQMAGRLFNRLNEQLS